jgi:3-oxoacyl-[acyl-carrier protein] reductase
MFVRLCLIFVFIISPLTSLLAQDRLDQKVVIITGASKGIGRGIANVFANEGAKLLLVSRTEADLIKAADDLKAKGTDVTYIVADITKPEDMKRMADAAIKNYDRIDVLVHNAAGIYPPSRIENMRDEEWHEAIKTNLDGVYYAVKSVIPQMKKQQYGRIVFTSSISGPRVGLPTKSHYTAAKGGMDGFMKTIAIELAKYNITVNAVEPGNVETEGLRAKNDAKAIEARVKPIPMMRLATPEEVAYAHLFLASDEAAYITGQSIIVDGGQVLPETHFDDY